MPLSADHFDVRRPAVVRRWWGTGIGVVMLLAVGPYPIGAFFVDGEIPHRIHNVVGSVQYLPLWAVPVLCVTWERDADAAWRLAFTSSCVMFAVGLWSGDLIPSLSWMPLLAALPLWRRGVWRSIRRPAPGPAAAAVVSALVTIRNVPHLIELQRLDMGDSHSARFHFSGMAAAYIAITAGLALSTLYRSGRLLQVLVAAAALTAGVASLAWNTYESALPVSDAWLMVAASAVSAVSLARPHADAAARSCATAS